MLQSFGKLGQAIDDKTDKLNGKFQHARRSSLRTVDEIKKHNKSVDNNGNNYNMYNINENKRIKVRKIKSANIRGGTRRQDPSMRKRQFMNT